MSDDTLADDLWTQRPSFVQLLRKRRWYVVLAAATVLLISGALYPILPRSYTSTTLVLLQPTDQAGQPIVGRSTMNQLDENEIQAYDDIISSRYMLQNVIDKLHLLDDPEFNPTLTQSRFQGIKNWIHAMLMVPPMYADEAVALSVRKHLFIVRAKKSYAFQIGFSSGSASKAAAMANTLANAFVADRLANKMRFQNDLTKHLEVRQTGLEQAYADSENKLHAYLVESGLIHRGEREAYQRQLDAFSTQYAQAQSLADQLADRAKTVSEMQRTGNLDASPDVLASPVIRDLKERVITLSSGTGAGAAISGSATPANLAELRNQINTEAGRIARGLQAEANIARAHANALRTEITYIDTKLMAWKEAERRLEIYERQADADRNALKSNMDQLRAQGSVIAALRSDADIISPAMASSRPSFPNLMLYAIGTIFVAMLVAAGVLLPAMLALPQPQRYRASYVR